MATPRSVKFSEMSQPDAVALIERHHVGRLAFSFHDRVDIEPTSRIARSSTPRSRCSERWTRAHSPTGTPRHSVNRCFAFTPTRSPDAGQSRPDHDHLAPKYASSAHVNTRRYVATCRCSSSPSALSSNDGGTRHPPYRGVDSALSGIRRSAVGGIPGLRRPRVSGTVCRIPPVCRLPRRTRHGIIRRGARVPARHRCSSPLVRRRGRAHPTGVGQSPIHVRHSPDGQRRRHDRG
jgi:hypothetical protein